MAWGLGQDSADQLDITGLVPQYGPDASVPLQVGNLASQISSSGDYSMNPATGQLQQNMIAGISNTGLFIGVGLLVGLFFFIKVASR